MEVIVMLYIGIDHHKSHSVFTCVNQNGDIIKSKKIYNSYQEIEKFLNDIENENEFEVVLEAGRNWGIMFDTLEKFNNIKKSILPILIKQEQLLMQGLRLMLLTLPLLLIF